MCSLRESHSLLCMAWGKIVPACLLCIHVCTSCILIWTNAPIAIYENIRNTLLEFESGGKVCECVFILFILSVFCRVVLLLELAVLALQWKQQEVVASCLKELNSAKETVSDPGIKYAHTSAACLRTRSAGTAPRKKNDMHAIWRPPVQWRCACWETAGCRFVQKDALAKCSCAFFVSQWCAVLERHSSPKDKASMIHQKILWK